MSVDINAKTVTLTLTNPVIDGDTVTVAYTDPSAANDANAIQDLAGNDVASLSAHAVTNNSPDVTPPVFASVAVNGSTLVLNYTDANLLSSNAASANAFTVLSNGNANAVTAVSINTSAKTVTLTLTSPVVEGDTVTVAYTDPTANNDANAIQDATGNDATSLPVHAVTNNTPDVTPPIFGSAAVNGSTLVLTYTDVNLLSSSTASISDFTVLKNNNANAVTAVSVDANTKTVTLTLTNPVINGDIVTVDYTDPTANNDANAIQDLAGNDAASLPSHVVTNNTPSTTSFISVKPNTLLFPGHTMGEWAHLSAFAAIKSDGSVVSWGDSAGNSSFVASQLDGTVDVMRIFSNYYVFAALRSDGSVITWGPISSGFGADSSAVASQLDGTIDVVQVFSTTLAFAGLRVDGSVVTWGYDLYGGNSSAVASQLNGTIDVVQIFSNERAFAALRADGSVITWGSTNGGDSSGVASQLNGAVDVVQVSSIFDSFAALRVDGSVITWGMVTPNANVASQLDGTIDVVRVFSNEKAFAALRVDGSVVTWGAPVTWNNPSQNGGDSSAVASQLDGTIDVVHVFSTRSAFAALRADGSVVTWGYNLCGGDSSVSLRWYAFFNNTKITVKLSTYQS